MRSPVLPKSEPSSPPSLATGEVIVGGAAHEFSNVLTVIQAALDSALRSPVLDDSLRPLLQVARDACQRGGRISRSLLRPVGRGWTELSPRDVDAHLGGMKPLLAHVAGPDIRIDFRLDAGGARAIFDPAWLDIVVLNLVANARNASPGGAVIRVSSVLAAADAHAGARVEIAVADEGRGMSPEVLAQVFEPGFTTRREEGGNGLGLSLVRELMQSMGGSISIESAPGRGTRAVLRMPAATGSDQAQRAPSRAVSASAPPEPQPVLSNAPAASRVLVVEDDVGLRELVEVVLAGEGYAVLTAGNAREAIELLESGEFDLVFSDVLMPGGMDGTELAERIAARWPRTRILLASGFFEQAGTAANRWAMLPKPYDPAMLLREVARMLGGR